MSGSESPPPVLAVDPGTAKVGYAIVRVDGTVVEHGIAAVADVGEIAADAVEARDVKTIIVGDGTGHRHVLEIIEERVPRAELAIVSERTSTLEARDVYFEDNPPRGWRRLLPPGLRIPPTPYDDYVAIILARRFFSRTGSER